MRTSILIFIILWIVPLSVLSQFSYIFSVDFRNDIIFDKNTGLRLTFTEINQLLEKNPNLFFDPVINKFGEYGSYLVDPINNESITYRDTSKRVSKNGKFLPFVMKTIDNKIIDSDSLIGRVVLLHFNLAFIPPFFEKKYLDNFNELIKEFQKTSDVVSIIISESPKDEVLEQIGSEKFIPDIVPNGRNFNERYLVIQFPTYILIDKQGNLVSYYTSSDLKELKSDFYKIR